MPLDIPVTATSWSPCYRIIPSRFPPIGLFEKVADPDDLEAVFQIEAMTNDRLRDEVGILALVPPEDRVSGPGTTPIMAAFTHLNPEGSRFTDGSFGVFYAGHTLDTAIAETRHHRTRFLTATDEPAQEIDMRVYAIDLEASLHDIRGLADSHGQQLLHSSASVLPFQCRRDQRCVPSAGIGMDGIADGLRTDEAHRFLRTGISEQHLFIHERRRWNIPCRHTIPEPRHDGIQIGRLPDRKKCGAESYRG